MQQWQLRDLSTEEIIETIHIASEFGGTIERPLIFSREKFFITSFEIKDQEIIITLNEEMTISEEARHICIDLNYRRMQFIVKSSDYHIQGNTIRTKFPQSAKGLLKRPHPRFKLSYIDYPSSITRAERRGGQYELESFIDDVSMSGICVLIKKTDLGDELIQNDHVWIKQIAGKHLNAHIFGKVVYTFNVLIDGIEYLKAGIRLEKEFDEELFSQITKEFIAIQVA